MKAVVAAFNQEKALVGAFSVITNLRMQLFEALDQVAEVVGVAGVDGRVGAAEDLQHQVLHAARLEGVLQRGHLVQDAAHRPQVGLVVVRLVLANLRAEVVRCPDAGLL